MFDTLFAAFPTVLVFFIELLDRLLGLLDDFTLRQDQCLSLTFHSFFSHFSLSNDMSLLIGLYLFALCFS